MIMANARGEIVLVNNQTENLFGYQREELIGQPIELLVPERFRRHHPVYRTNFFQAPQARPMGAGRDLFGLHKDGSEFPIEIALNPIETAEGLMVLSAIVDITTRKQAEESIKASLKEKEVLLKEIHHRVKNNLQVICSLLNLQAGYTSDQPTSEMFRESQQRVRSMALVHETLYRAQDLARIDFAEYVQSLTASLARSYGRPEISVALKGERSSVFLGVDKAVPCGLIVNELVSNALKHAFPKGRKGEVCVTLQGDSGLQLTLDVSDDGVGFPARLDFRNTTSLGLQLVNTLTEQLQGTIALQNYGGTTFQIQFPI
jgi:PAS domain S-box-containing protein